MSPKLVDVLVVLALHDDGHHHVQYTPFGYHLAGAVLVDLLLRGRVEGDDARLTARNTDPTGHPVLDEAAALIAKSHSGVKPARVIMTIGKVARRRVLDHLVDVGTLRRTRRSVLLLFNRDQFVETRSGSDSIKATSIARLRGALSQEGALDDETAALCAFVAALDWQKRLLPELDSKSARQRLTEIGASCWATRSVKRTLDSVFVGNVGLRF